MPDYARYSAHLVNLYAHNSTVDEVARSLGESKQTLSRGLELATAAIFSGLSGKTADSETLRQVVDLASKTLANFVSSALATGQLTNPNSPLISGGKKLSSSLFGSGQDAVLNSISREAGLRAGVAPTVMAVAAQTLLSDLGTSVREEGITATTLPAFLHSTGTGSLKTPAAPPPKVRESSPVLAQTIETDPVVFQTERKEGSFPPWLGAILLVLLLGVTALWWALQSHRAPVAEAPVASAPVVIAPVAAPPPDLGAFVPRQLPGGATLNIPERGVEGRLLAFIQDPSRAPDKTTWFDFDRLLFATGSATLQPQSEEQLHNIAAILGAYPNVHLKIGGYTDDVGSAASNLKLSQDRATNVMDELVHLGIAPGRLAAQGYGEEHPVGDNASDSGRALNRRISMLVTNK